ncbi:hypothetical protein [Flavobacterium sp. 3HN19-14]|uniref:hypothetical protein n=1 Tax=Flavobacterium sp. 3HN19-14 TaxID=3448133 RepID=UPI003EE3F7D8
METNNNQLHIFRTNVTGLCPNCALHKALSEYSGIDRWTIDHEDIDCVLRVETEILSADALITLLNHHGFECSELE